MSCVVSGFLLEPFLDCRELRGITVADELLFLAAQALPGPARVTVTEQRFLAEEIACVDVKARRAAVVMVWAMTVDHLERYVLNHKLPEFNTAWAKRTDCRGRTIAGQDDFLEFRNESTFIEILRSATIVTNDVRKILDEKLGFRNTCAHPNDIVIPDSKVLSAIEDLVYNVILKYPL